jgi:hypothetical protein
MQLLTRMPEGRQQSVSAATVALVIFVMVLASLSLSACNNDASSDQADSTAEQSAPSDTTTTQ